MLTLHDYLINDLLHEGQQGCVYRGRRLSDGLAVVLKTAHPHRADASFEARLRHEHAVLEGLAGCQAVPQVVAWLRDAGRPVLVLQDLGAESLGRLAPGRPWALREFFPVALAAVQALRQVHERQVVHRDLKPQNIVLRRDTGRLQLVDFGLASRLPREQLAALPPERLEGTLAYMAPEQTGRMNRAVDDRADYYSLGATLYELLCGRPPFMAQDALELVHCHLARTPTHPAELVPGLPRMLGELVLRLLNKHAEDRYQSLNGLLTDLHECEARWRRTGDIASFELARHDAAGRFQPPERLYGRERDIECLVHAFGHAVERGETRLVWIGGPSGIGKSALVAELHKPVVAGRGYYIVGKCDQFSRDLPLAAPAAALHSLVQQLLAEDEARLQAWRHRLRAAVGEAGAALVALIPPLGLVLGELPAAPELPADQARVRLTRAFAQLVGAFAQAGCPLVLFLDDLQWADSASLDLLGALCAAGPHGPLLLIGAYRDNEVHPAHPLILMRDNLPAERRGQTLSLSPLTPAQVGQLLADTLHSSACEVWALAEQVHAKTRGNPFFTGQFVATLYQDGLVTFDAAAQRWAWDLARIEQRNFTDNVVEHMLAELLRLPPGTQQALTQAAFLGGGFSLHELARLRREPVAQTEEQLWPARALGLVMCHDGQGRFLHDRVQEASGLLTPPEERAALHARIGRHLLAHTDPAQRDEKIFDIVFHLNAAGDVLSQPSERRELARLNRRAGERARAASAHAVAAEHFARAVQLLGPRAWSNEPAHCFELTLARGECETLAGQLDLAQTQLTLAVDRAGDPLARSRALLAQIYLQVTRGDNPGACASAQASLDALGLALPACPDETDIQHGCAAIDAWFGGRPIETLLDLPAVADPHIEMAIRVLTSTSTAAIFTNQQLWAFHDTQMVLLSLRHGNADSSVMAYTFYGFMLGAYLHRYQEGYRFCQVARELTERRSLRQHRGSLVYHQALAALWVDTLGGSIAHMKQSIPELLEAGNLIIACLAGRFIVLYMMLRGDPLADLQQEIERCGALAQQASYPMVTALAGALQGLLDGLRGDAPPAPSHRLRGLDEARRIPFVAVAEHLAALSLHTLMGDHARACERVEQAEPLMWATVGLLPNHDHFYYGAVSLAAQYPTLAPEAQPGARERLQRHLEQLARWAQSNPQTFACSHLLVAAELARIDGRVDALGLYERAIEQARAGGFLQREALACERAAEHCLQLGAVSAAQPYLAAARGAYLRWGAEAKVRQLDLRFPRQELLSPRASTPTLTLGPEDSRCLAVVDALALTRASQAISGQIEADALVQRLMEVVLQQAGAEFGVLLLDRGQGEMRPAATATVHGEAIRVSLCGPADVLDLPAALLALVQRTRAPVLINDLRAVHPLVADTYLAAAAASPGGARSVYGLPIQAQGHVLGVLYLEHRRLPNAFGREHLGVLESLAAQAAISLENARCYTELRRAKDEADAANTAKSAFLANLSHEVRTPLNAAIGLTQLVLDSALEAPQRRHLQQALDASHALLGLLNDILDFSALEAGQLALATADFWLADCPAAGSGRLAKRAAAKGLQLVQVLDPQLPVAVHGDMQRLTQVLGHLLDNAIKFTETGQVTLSLSLQAQDAQGLSMCVAVRDTGIGLSEAQCQRLFQAFSQADTSLTRRYGGVGLGLNIVAGLVRAMGGRMEVHSVPGQGSEFSFTMRVARAHAAPELRTPQPGATAGPVELSAPQPAADQPPLPPAALAALLDELRPFVIEQELPPMALADALLQAQRRVPAAQAEALGAIDSHLFNFEYREALAAIDALAAPGLSACG